MIDIDDYNDDDDDFSNDLDYDSFADDQIDSFVAIAEFDEENTSFQRRN